MMKAPLVFSIFFAGAAAWGQVAPVRPPENTPVPVPAGQAAAASTSLSFEAKSVSSGGATKVANTGGGGLNSVSVQSTQTHQSSIRLEVRVRNFGTLPAQAHLDCYFVASELSHGRRFIWDSQTRDLAVPAGREMPELVQSKEITQTSERSFESSVTTDVNGNNQVKQTVGNRTSGSKPYGWIVRLTSGDRILKVQASSSELESVARDPSLIAKMEQQPKTFPPLKRP